VQPPLSDRPPFLAAKLPFVSTLNDDFLKKVFDEEVKVGGQGQHG
jgi:hypothetical protein